jgi:MoaA/NifB/PqqE/SkfB family radical SAM enzyme
MADQESPMWPFLQNVGLMLTYKCQVSCPHCIVECSPNRTEEMRETDAPDWIRQIAHYRNGHIKVLSLTGGEPLFDIERFRRVAGCAAKNGLLPTAVTNAYWATNPDRALEVLRSIPSIAVLSISTDSYHQKSIPIERVFHAIEAARACSIPCTVSICTESRDDPEYRSLLRKLEETIGPENITTVTTLLAGRALVTIQPSVYETTPEPAPYCCVPAAAPVIFPDGRVIACIGPLITLNRQHPLVLGNLRDMSLEEIFDRAEVNPILHALRVWGPKKLCELARAAGWHAELPSSFVAENVCDACYQIFSRPGLAPFLDGLASDPEFARVTAYARMYYLKEDEMADRLFGTCQPR